VVPVYVVGADLVSLCELERVCEWVALALDLVEWVLRLVVVNGFLFSG
jgi:hypothetical protein